MVASASLQGAEINDLLGAAGHMQGKAFAVLQRTGGFHHDIDAVVGPFPFALGAAGDGDLVIVDLQAVFGGLHFAGEAAVHGVVLEQVGHFFVAGTMAVDDNHFALGEEVHDAKQISADTAKTIDAYPDHGKTPCSMGRGTNFGVSPLWGARPAAIFAVKYKKKLWRCHGRNITFL